MSGSDAARLIRYAPCATSGSSPATRRLRMNRAYSSSGYAVSRHCRGLPTKICRHSQPMATARSTARCRCSRMLTCAPNFTQTPYAKGSDPSGGNPSLEVPMMSARWGFTTKAIHGGRIDDANKSVAPPIYQTATYYYDTAEEGIRIGQEVPPGYIYTRWANPTTRVLEERVALLEGAEDALALSSGMAAVTSAVMTVLKPGDHAVAPRAIYQASYQLFAEVLPQYGIDATLLTDTDVESYERALRPSTRLLYIETPNNPVLDITDIAGVVALARGREAMTIADNTFATPYNQSPIALGVDVVVHSATKYLGGHHDVTAGALAGTREFVHASKRHARIFGTTIDPFGAWLVLRGLATLGLRVERQNRSAQALAEFLAPHPRVERVHY